jgi:hypothetical protein
LIASEPYEYTNSDNSKIPVPTHNFKNLRFLSNIGIEWKHRKHLTVLNIRFINMLFIIIRSVNYLNNFLKININKSLNKFKMNILNIKYTL